MREFILKDSVLQALPIPIRTGIEELERRFLKMNLSSLSNQEFVGQIRGSIQTFFSAIEEAHGTGDNSLLLDQLESIEDGIQFIKGAITNRLLAGRYLYEVGLFNPHNMGPFSQLYLFYESFVDLFESLINDYNKKGYDRTKSKTNFLVDISTYSSVNAQQFVPYTTKAIPKNVIVGITINEHVFLQVYATMVLLLHEIGHYVRPFERVERNKVLLKVVILWLTNMVYGQLNDYLNEELFSLDYQDITIEETQKINKVREHFEAVVFPIVNAALYEALDEYFKDFTHSKSVISKFGNQDQYSHLLVKFQELLEFFMSTLSNELSDILFSPIKDMQDSNKEITPEPASSSGITAKIEDWLDKVTTFDNKDVQERYFDHLCAKASSLFEPNNVFKYKDGVGNSEPGHAIDAYLEGLARSGLNEASRANRDHFVELLNRCLKRALDAMKEEPVVDRLFRNVDEALAHMFWIRTLDISDFESYWKIMEPLVNQVAYTDTVLIKYFGIPNAIITEYFDLLLYGKPQDRSEYKIPPIDAKTPLPRVHSSNVTIAQEKYLQDFRTIIFIPVAKYLHRKDQVFPEDHLFQLGEHRLSEDAQLIVSLRERFRKFIEDGSPNTSFTDELHIINSFFKKHS